VCADSARVPQGTCDERAAAVGIARESSVPVGHTKTPACCLSCGRRWAVVPGSAARGTGCPVCVPYRFDPEAPSKLDLLLLPDPPVLKVGVMGDTASRLDLDRGRGWGS
jgi:hypothetical protein